MNELLQIVILAVVQGLTEFLPVSSSGHLVLIGHLIRFEEQGNLTEVILHVGTFLAVILYFWKRLMSLAAGLLARDKPSLLYIGALALGSIPTIAIYFLAGDTIESLFDKPVWSAVFLCITGVILLSTLLCKSSEKDIDTGRGFFIGVAQAFALLPGISRSGSTIVLARHLGIKPGTAAEFSFLLSLPAMAGAILIKSIGLIKGEETITPLPAIIGILVSAAVGYLALVALLAIVKKGKLWTFGIYCLLAGAISFLLLR